jgi:hypothetical protein
LFGGEICATFKFRNSKLNITAIISPPSSFKAGWAELQLIFIVSQIPSQAGVVRTQFFDKLQPPT